MWLSWRPIVSVAWKLKAFLQRADKIFVQLQKHFTQEHDSSGHQQQDQDNDSLIKSPAIPHGYDLLTQYHMQHFGLTRDQLRMAVCLESFHANLHPESLLYRRRQVKKQLQEADNKAAPCKRHPGYTTLQEVREAPSVTPNISLLECARRANGAACLVLASNRFLARQGLYREGLPTVVSGGESSGPLYPHPQYQRINEAYLSCEQAMSHATYSWGCCVGVVGCCPTD